MVKINYNFHAAYFLCDVVQTTITFFLNWRISQRADNAVLNSTQFIIEQKI